TGQVALAAASQPKDDSKWGKRGTIRGETNTVLMNVENYRRKVMSNWGSAWEGLGNTIHSESAKKLGRWMQRGNHQVVEGRFDRMTSREREETLFREKFEQQQGKYKRMQAAEPF